jgi:hypothetical protein
MEPVNLEYFPDLCNRKYKIVELVADHLRESGLDEDELNRADVNYDGVIDIFDVLLIVDLVLD